MLLLEGTSACHVLPNRKKDCDMFVSEDMLSDPNAVIASMVSRNASAKALFRVRLTSDKVKTIAPHE